MLVLLDAEFTDFTNPQLLSLGLVPAADGSEHYVELDLDTDIGQKRRRAANEFVRDSVLDSWGLVPGAKATYWEMGRRTGEWLLGRAAQACGRVEVGFDYDIDFELLVRALREAGLWDQVSEVILPIDIGPLTATIEAELAAESAYREMNRRGLGRHHALADAHALAHAYRAVKERALGRPAPNDDYKADASPAHSERP